MSNRITLTKEPTREEWLQARRAGIGASEIAAIVGVSPYTTPLQVYLEKTGQVPPQEETWPMWWGTHLEPVLLEAYTKKTGRKAVLNGNRTFQHPEVSCLFATPDAFEVETSNDGVELKAPGFRMKDGWGPEGTDEIPEMYLCQVSVQMACTGRNLWHAGAKLDHDFKVYDIKRDGDLVASLVTAAEKFWHDHVQRRVPPEAGRMDLDVLKEIYKRDEGEVREATPYERSLAEKLFPMKLRLEADQGAYDELKAKLIASLGECPGLVLPGLGKISNKYARGPSKVDWEAIARSYNPPPLVIEQHTVALPGVRRFRITPEKTKEN